MSYYITLIAPDGGGKDTLFNRLMEDYPEAVPMYEPGGTKEADVIRRVLLAKEDTIDERIVLLENLLQSGTVGTTCATYLKEAIRLLRTNGLTGETEAYLYAASRAETNQRVIIPSIKDKKMVLGRRSVACSMSYQGHARGLGMSKIWSINEPAMKDAYPSLEIYLDVPVHIAQERLKARDEKQDRLDGESVDFHALTVEGYHRYYREYCPYPFVIVDGTLSKEDLYQEVKTIIEGTIGR